MRRTMTLLLLLCLTAVAGHADVIESTPSGFTIRTSVEIAATPRSVYNALSAQVSNWWDPEHTWSGNPRNLSVKIVDQVLAGQVHRLKRYIESGPLR